MNVHMSVRRITQKEEQAPMMTAVASLAVTLGSGDLRFRVGTWLDQQPNEAKVSRDGSTTPFRPVECCSCWGSYI
jgi:hypothetical protein